MMKKAGLIALVGLGLTFSAAAQTPTSKRTELTKGDLTRTNMEVIVGVLEVPPGASGTLHTHAGEEAVYVIEGGTAVSADGKPLTYVPGTARINVRDVPHGAFTVTGDKTLKLLTVHVVDKGKPLYIPAKP
jgi:quercetin dioxygenase-like cupin family protein